MRTIVIGGPRSGKSTYARMLKGRVPIFCTDPKSLVKEPEEGVTYLPEGLGWSECSEYICNNWFTMPGEWCVEGIAAVRALRKYIEKYDGKLPEDFNIVRFEKQHGKLLEGQRRMGKSVQTIWTEISDKIKTCCHYNNDHI